MIVAVGLVERGRDATYFASMDLRLGRAGPDLWAPQTHQAPMRTLRPLTVFTIVLIAAGCSAKPPPGRLLSDVELELSCRSTGGEASMEATLHQMKDEEWVQRQNFGTIACRESASPPRTYHILASDYGAGQYEVRVSALHPGESEWTFEYEVLRVGGGILCAGERRETDGDVNARPCSFSF